MVDHSKRDKSKINLSNFFEKLPETDTKDSALFESIVNDIKKNGPRMGWDRAMWHRVIVHPENPQPENNKSKLKK
jgi:hypothetical protein